MKENIIQTKPDLMVSFIENSDKLNASYKGSSILFDDLNFDS